MYDAHPITCSCGSVVGFRRAVDGAVELRAGDRREGRLLALLFVATVPCSRCSGTVAVDQPRVRCA